jgi:hypothetical protein
MDAERAGMSYGKYKAMHPNTKDANEARLAEKRPYKPRDTYVATCCNCGRVFEADNKNTRHCSDECRRQAKNRKWRIAHGSKKI